MVARLPPQHFHQIWPVATTTNFPALPKSYRSLRVEWVHGSCNPTTISGGQTFKHFEAEMEAQCDEIAQSPGCELLNLVYHPQGPLGGPAYQIFYWFTLYEDVRSEGEEGV